MGQPIVVCEKPSAVNPGMVRFETNRALTGMGHERYRSLADTAGDRPPDVLARRLFERGGVDAVHINSNVITVDLTKGDSSDGIRQIIEDLYIFYPEDPPAADAASESEVETPAPESAADPAAAPEAAEADEPAPG